MMVSGRITFRVPTQFTLCFIFADLAMLTTSRINLVVIISEQTFSKCVFVFCNRSSSEKLYNKLPTKASYTHAEIEHEVKE